MICVVYYWRCKKTNLLRQSERYTRNIALSRRKFRDMLATLDAGRLVCTKTHTGIKYANGGRFS